MKKLIFAALFSIGLVASAAAQLMSTGFGSYSGGVATSTWNPADKGPDITLSGGNLIATGDNVAVSAVRGTASHSSGKWYFECTITTTGSGGRLGVATSATSLTSTSIGSSDATSAGLRYGSTTGGFANSGANTITASTVSSGNVIGVAVDVTNHLIYWSINGTWQNSAVPSSGTGGLNYITTNPVFPIGGASATSGSPVFAINTGGSTFNTAAPSGFSAWQ